MTDKIKVIGQTFSHHSALKRKPEFVFHPGEMLVEPFNVSLIKTLGQVKTKRKTNMLTSCPTIEKLSPLQPSL